MGQNKKVWLVTGSGSGLGRKAFNTTPQKWIIQKRLELAHYQLSENRRKPVDVYIEAGFENLSHFSFAFKKHFGYSPAMLPNDE